MKRTTQSQLMHDAKRKEKLMNREIKVRAPRAHALKLEDMNIKVEDILRLGYQGPTDETLMVGFYVLNTMNFYFHPKYTRYCCDKDGNVYHMTPNGRVLKIKPVWLNSKDKHYMIINVYNKDKKPLTMTLHKFICEAFYRKEVPPHMDIHHKDFNPLNNSPFNLMFIDESEHMSIHGQQNKGKKYRKEK